MDEIKVIWMDNWLQIFYKGNQLYNAPCEASKETVENAVTLIKDKQCVLKSMVEIGTSFSQKILNTLFEEVAQKFINDHPKEVIDF